MSLVAIQNRCRRSDGRNNTCLGIALDTLLPISSARYFTVMDASWLEVVRERSYCSLPLAPTLDRVETKTLVHSRIKAPLLIAARRACQSSADYRINRAGRPGTTGIAGWAHPPV